MILESTIRETVEYQKLQLSTIGNGFPREKKPGLKSISTHALIISGIRRCGKSTLAHQIMETMQSDKILYLNFETPRLYGFSVNDFSRLDNIIAERRATILFFDEIQDVEGWEIFIREKLDEQFKIIITGSNARLLSYELGTKLTGRQITYELFPFSYSEYVSCFNLKTTLESFKEYSTYGGFPDYLTNKDEDILTALFDDILVKDIIVRHGIKDSISIKKLSVYLFNNIGNRVTATKLKQVFSVSATSTLMSWFSFLESTYLVFFLPMYSHSTKAQLINPRKIYCIDNGLLNAISSTLTQDEGRKLENIIFMHLRRSYTELFYFDEGGECDFVVLKNSKVEMLVQVCHSLNQDNLDREVNGLLKAMKFFNCKNGKIVTLNDKDKITIDGFEIEVMPAYRFMTMK
jgi:uncharacterized protein